MLTPASELPQPGDGASHPRSHGCVHMPPVAPQEPPDLGPSDQSCRHDEHVRPGEQSELVEHGARYPGGGGEPEGSVVGTGFEGGRSPSAGSFFWSRSPSADVCPLPFVPCDDDVDATRPPQLTRTTASKSACFIH